MGTVEKVISTKGPMIILAKQLINLRVKTKSGQYLGRVRDFELDSESLEFKKIYVRPVGIIKRFVSGDLLISRDSIISIDDKYVIVMDLVGQELVKAEIEKKRLMVESPVSAANID